MRSRHRRCSIAGRTDRGPGATWTSVSPTHTERHDSFFLNDRPDPTRHSLQFVPPKRVPSIRPGQRPRPARLKSQGPRHRPGPAGASHRVHLLFPALTTSTLESTRLHHTPKHRTRRPKRRGPHRCKRCASISAIHNAPELTNRPQRSDIDAFPPHDSALLSAIEPCAMRHSLSVVGPARPHRPFTYQRLRADQSVRPGTT